MKNKYKHTIQRFVIKPSIVLDRHPIICVLALAFVVTLVVEMASRHSPLKGIVFLFTHPVNFTANMTIVLMTLATGLFFKKRVFFFSQCHLVKALAEPLLIEQGI